MVKVQGGPLVFADGAGGGRGPGVLPVETIAASTYSQVAADNLKFKRTTSTSTVTVTIEANVNAANDEITQQGGDGQIALQAGAGMTLTTSGTLVSGGPGAVVRGEPAGLLPDLQLPRTTELLRLPGKRRDQDQHGRPRVRGLLWRGRHREGRLQPEL